MVIESGGQTPNRNEVSGSGVHIVIIKNWDKSALSLQQLEAGEILTTLGFDLPTLAATLTKEFASGLPSHPEYNDAGQKIEDIITETISVNGRPLDRLLVTAYAAAANHHMTEMTKFLSGGEVIWITDGEAELTYARGQEGEYIHTTDLTVDKVSKGDLIISTNTPNNWTRILDDKFSFVYFVGNPIGPQKYGDIPKTKIPIK